ncbi:apolipoprotein N-acyltransferase [Acidovorax sp. SUPP2522]|uniref:apolipoprotein N-acyltransferase n=1 Tax=unclassified Acidovorax TaxID=2684926 RepID=UPI00234BDD0C|nr:MULTISPECIES: apolipoprotein N-acyltransferase [unclassified Acidovorax]WCM96988.1 apolipoprotein N-acyltransferase [Acidovorax sp. GBBC 1281]GKT15180.1 apolipoprotein N-acyltransferase [Acidovorax sp. SUPP2522]
MGAAGARSGPLGPVALAGGLALLAGLAQAASIAWPFGGEPVWWMQLLSLGGFARLLLASRSARQAAVLGWLFATAWLTGTFWWLFISMHTYGGLAAPLAALAVVGLAAFLGSYYAVAAGCFKALGQSNRWHAAIVFGAFWLLAELARGQWWTGFPWGAGGYAHVEGPLAVLARSVGMYGIGCVAAVLAMLVAQGRRSDLRSLKAWALVGLAVLAWAGLAVQRHCAVELCHTPMQRPAPLSLALLQGNIPQDEKFQAGSGVPTALRWYAEQLRSAQAALVVAPETAIPLLPQQLVPGYLDSVTARYTQAPAAGQGAGRQAALLGIPLGDMALGYTNSVMGFAPGQAAPYQYDKHHLVPFGEFIPPFFRWFTEMMNIPLGDFNRGAVGQAPFLWAGERIAPNICYEDLFGEELGARFTDPAQAPTIFVNLSNIGWFGDSVAIDQHLAISRMRALEFERPMVRATNTGATAIIDHRGVVTQRLPSHVRGVLTGEVQGRSGAVTPYAYWVSRWGLWPLWALGALVAGLAWVRRRRARRAATA